MNLRIPRIRKKEAGKMLDLQKVTLVSISSTEIVNSVRALRISSEGINFGSIKLLSHDCPATLPNNIEFCKIKQITSIDDYSYRTIYELPHFIKTDFALIIQQDGFVVNVSSWREEFLAFDYIGAPWTLPRDSFSYRDRLGKIVRVGNGGFSMRSKRLLDLANALNLPWEPFHGYYNEDGFICCKNRHLYEANGCKFAPIEVAAHFSREALIPEFEHIVPFGFHGKNSPYINRLNDY
jgi:hypothetical protein